MLILGGMDGVGQALIQLRKKARASVYVSAPKLRHVYLNSVLGVTPLLEMIGFLALKDKLTTFLTEYVKMVQKSHSRR